MVCLRAMSHPLEDIIRTSEGFVLIGDSTGDTFPAMSFHAYNQSGKRFYCIDLGGLTESRGKAGGQPLYTVETLPSDHDDLAVIWTKPRRAREAVDVALAAGCKRVWFSFQCGHKEAVAHARDSGMEVVEIGRCPVHYLPHGDLPAGCKWHARMTKLTGTYGKPPQVDAEAKRRELY